MKKIMMALFMGIITLSLASCNNTEIDYNLHDETNKDAEGASNITKDWLNTTDIAVKEPIKVREDKKESGYEISLPQDPLSVSRYTLTNLEDKNIYNTDQNSDSWQNSLFDGIYFLYLTQYNVDLTEVSNQLNQVGEEITSAYGDLGASLFDTVNEVADDKLSSLAYEEGKERSLAVLYLPVLVHAYTALEDKSGDAKETIRTFVLVPVYYEVVYATNGNLDANDKLSGYKKVDIASSSSLIDDYKE